MKFTKMLNGAELFATGQWNGLDFSTDDLDQMVDAFDALMLRGRVPLKLGHEGPDARNNPASQFAMGWVKRIWRDGDVLKADLEVPDKAYEAVREGFIKNVSVELLKDVKAGTRIIPWVLDAVALLGADQPAVGVLKDLQTLTMSRVARMEHGARVTFRRDESSTIGDTGMNDEDKKRFSALEASVTTLTADLAKEREARASDAKERAKERAEFRRRELKARFTMAIQGQQLLPRSLERFERQFRVADDAAVMAVSDTDVETFINDAKETDAVQLKKNGAPGARGTGTGTQDDAAKADIGKPNAQVFTRRCEAEVVRVGEKLGDIAAMRRASARIMKSDPHLAEAYLNNPQGEYAPAASA